MANDIYSLASDMIDELVEVVPVAATYFGVAGHDHRWNDFSTAGSERERRMQEDHLQRIRRLPPSDDRRELLARRVIEASIEDDLMLFETNEHLRDLNSMASAFQDLREVFDQMGRVTREDWRNVADRMQGLPLALHAYGSRLEDGRREGLLAAQRQVHEVARQARNHAGDDSFFVRVAAEAAHSDTADETARKRIDRALGEVRAAFAGFADYLEQTYLPDAPVADAVGEERYVALARRFLGTSVDPRRTYEWGWSEVERLRLQMETVADAVSPGASMQEALHLLSTDPERAAASPEEFRDLMYQRQQQALADLDGVHFDVPEPIRAIDVKLTPPGGALSVYYVAPSEDYQRSGTVWWSLGDKQVIPMFDQISTAYHEGFPGHHLQSGFQMADGSGLTRYQKLAVWYPGTGEGWALYSEDLMEEFGYLEKPDYVMGKLASEMLRAARVVIDIGSHLGLMIPDGQPFHPGESWNYDSGVELLTAYAGQSPETARAEMNRYLGWPGQAISYKIGQQAIRDLRDEAGRRHGDGFDLKAFNARVLEIGSVGIDVLREYVSEF